MIGRSWLAKVAITNDCDLHWDETIMTSGEAYPTGKLGGLSFPNSIETPNENLTRRRPHASRQHDRLAGHVDQTLRLADCVVICRCMHPPP